MTVLHCTMTSRECESDADVVADSVDPGLHPPQRRVCKHCTFSTSNTKEFLHHQLTTHSDHAEDASTSDMASKPKSASEPLSPSRHDSIGSGSQPPSPQRISDSGKTAEHAIFSSYTKNDYSGTPLVRLLLLEGWPLVMGRNQYI